MSWKKWVYKNNKLAVSFLIGLIRESDIFIKIDFYFKKWQFLTSDFMSEKGHFF